jgi:hypothetical protein
MTLQFLGVSLTLCFVISKKTTFSTVDSTVTARRFPFVVTWLAAWLSKMIKHPMILVHLLEKTTQAKPKKLFVIFVTMFCIGVRFFPWIFRSRLKCLHNPQPNRTLVSTFKHCTIIPWSLQKSQEIREFCGNLRWTLCHDVLRADRIRTLQGSEDFVPPSTLVIWWHLVTVPGSWDRWDVAILVWPSSTFWRSQRLSDNPTQNSFEKCWKWWIYFTVKCIEMPLCVSC